MKPNTPIIEAVGPERLLHIVTSMVKCRSQLDPEAQRTLDESVLEFLGRNPLALATLMLDRTLPDTHPGEVEALLRRAYDRASEIGRERVEKQAMEAGYFDLFGQAKAREEPFLTRSQRAGLDRMVTVTLRANAVWLAVAWRNVAEPLRRSPAPVRRRIERSSR